MIQNKTDITDQTSQENCSQDLQLNIERLRMVLEGSELGFWDWNIISGEVQRNDRWAQMLGYRDIQDFKNNTDSWTNQVHPDDREAAWQSINDHLENRTSAHKMEYRMLTKQGEYKWILDNAKVVQRDSEGKPTRMSGTHLDISSRKKIEHERDELINSLQTALDEIKTLKGIIPICSYCHNIRDDRGAWNRLESYLAKHSDVEFSHGICPDCLEKVRSEVSDN